MARVQERPLTCIVFARVASMDIVSAHLNCETCLRLWAEYGSALRAGEYTTARKSAGADMEAICESIRAHEAEVHGKEPIASVSGPGRRHRPETQKAKKESSIPEGRMEKSTSEKTLISDAVTEPVDSAAQLKRLKDRNSALKKELSDCESAAASDLPLLASGLRLAFANEELRGKVAALRKDASKQAAERKAKGSGQP